MHYILIVEDENIVALDIQNRFLHQAVLLSVCHYKGEKAAKVLDLVFFEGDKMIDTVKHLEPFG